ncbi:MAG: hypothetical protein HN368_22745, partial [Spirochaetales bacterium]|nr:hypothetical protein [Spirochaetales bacterium]
IHPTESLVKSLDGDQQIVLYLLAVADQAVGRSLLFSFLVTEGFDLASLKGYAELFSEYMLYPAPDEGQNDHIVKCTYSLLRSRADDITGKLANFAADRLSEGKLLLDRQTIHFFLAAEHPLFVHLVSVYISWLLTNGRVKDAGALLEEIESDAEDSDVLIPLCAMRLRTLVFQSNLADASKLYSELKKTTSRKSAIEGVKRLESARYLYGTGSFPDALQEAKEALMLFQEQNSENEVYACTYVGLAMLGQSRLDESEAYFNIAEESTASSETPSAVFNGMCSAATQYLVGNITRAKRIAEKWLEISSQQGMRSYQIVLLFYMMRFHFDLGQYEICIQMCLQGLTFGKLYSSSSSIVFGRWLRRALAYSGNFSEALVGLDTTSGNLEDIYFAAECFFLQESYDKAVFCLEPVVGANYQMNKSLYPAEMVRWDSGYSMLEDRAIPGDTQSPVLSRLIRSFYSYLSCVEGISESALDDLARVNREERLSNIDPNNGVYLYYYSVALRRNSGAGDLDRLTALSKALKFVQERAAKMDDTGDKRLFLNGNFWNRRIFSDARSAKLV